MSSCVFCEIEAGDRQAHLVHEDPQVVAFLDRRPVFPGHVLVVPRAHHETLPELPADLVGPYFAAVQRITGAVIEAMEADGAFVAQNNTVSQSVPHLHFHVVPRRFKDGLKGFFWPRHPYESEAEAADAAVRIRAALGRG